jgi:uncharacterized Zn-finger protein
MTGDSTQPTGISPQQPVEHSARTLLEQQRIQYEQWRRKHWWQGRGQIDARDRSIDEMRFRQRGLPTAHLNPYTARLKARTCPVCQGQFSHPKLVLEAQDKASHFGCPICGAKLQKIGGEGWFARLLNRLRSRAEDASDE